MLQARTGPRAAAHVATVIRLPCDPLRTRVAFFLRHVVPLRTLSNSVHFGKAAVLSLC